MPTATATASRTSHLVAIGVGGGAGTALRAALNQTFTTSDGWPWPTFIANIVGTVLLVSLIMRAPRLMEPRGTARSLLGVGFCGGLTTFSLFQVEIVRFLKDGRVTLGLGYAAASLGVALLAAMAIPAKSSERR